MNDLSLSSIISDDLNSTNIKPIKTRNRCLLCGKRVKDTLSWSKWFSNLKFVCKKCNKRFDGNALKIIRQFNKQRAQMSESHKKRQVKRTKKGNKGRNSAKGY